MVLNSEQMQSIARGVVRAEEADGWFRFYRFTEEQESYYTYNPDFLKKTFASSGVRLAFYTNSESLAFDFQFASGSSRSYGWFDLYENGAMVKHFGSESADISSGHVSLPLSAGEKLVELYFPWSQRTDLKDVTLDDGATLTPSYRKKKMIAFGDSITHGYDAIYPSQSYVCRLARMLDADVIDKGIGGDVFCPDLLKTNDPVAPDIVTVAYGTNDWSCRTPEEYRENCRLFYTRLSELYPEAKIFAITPIWRRDASRSNSQFGAPAWETHNAIAECVEGLPNVTLIRGWDLVPHLKAFFSDFSVHPNDAGFAAYAEGLYCEIVKYL